MRMTKQKIIVGLSGGVDSAVSAYLLQKQGYDVRAAFMKNFSERISIHHDCPWKEDRLEAYKVAAFLKIPIVTWDFEKEYRAKVLNYMFAEYQRGRTPNPDIMCNKEIKFKIFLKRAQKAGASYIATGHYAQIKHDKHGIAHLHKGKDTTKDQSYFLATLDQSQLQHALFPIGHMTKPQVRVLAKKIGLPNATRPDSQGICFVGNVPMTDFLKQRIKPKRGDIVDTKGNVLGSHSGVYYYTIGQRRGINIGGGAPLYVIDKDIRRNRIIVGTEKELQLFRSECMISDWHWLSEQKKLPLQAKAKIRYRQLDQTVTILKSSGKKVQAIFKAPQRAISPGQILAVYHGAELIASGTIV